MLSKKPGLCQIGLPPMPPYSPREAHETSDRRRARARARAPSHAEDAKRRLLDRRVGGGGEAEPEHVARVLGLDDAVVPDARRGERRGRRLVKLVEHGFVELGHLLLVHRLARFLGRRRLHLREHARRLFATHHADPRVRPHPHEPRRVGTAAHAVVARAKRATHHERELGDARGRHSVDELRAVLRDPLRLVLPAHHEARDVLHEQQRHAALSAQLHKVRPLDGRL
mmetsp:Transcript_48915/g.135698  ORF Transcript_48915/g.135698 Transcript_48915/m.135698 type:complete len:227 (-) Transcript_48915:35-715(-)